jgi:hypothetical protein
VWDDRAERDARGLVLLEHANHLQLVTAPDVGKLVEPFLNVGPPETLSQAPSRCWLSPRTSSRCRAPTYEYSRHRPEPYGDAAAGQDGWRSPLRLSGDAESANERHTPARLMNRALGHSDEMTFRSHRDLDVPFGRRSMIKDEGEPEIASERKIR